MSSTISHSQTEDQNLCLIQIGDLRCGVDLKRVVEISNNSQITVAKGAAPYVAGVSNLRGNIVTIIDPYKRLNIPPPENRDNRRLLIIESRGEKIGLLVDEVWSIIPVEPNRCDPTVKDIKQLDPSYHSGVYREDKHLVILLNLDGLLYCDSESHNSQNPSP